MYRPSRHNTLDKKGTEASVLDTQHAQAHNRDDDFALHKRPTYFFILLQIGSGVQGHQQ